MRKIYHWLLILIAIALLTGYIIITYSSPWQFLYRSVSLAHSQRIGCMAMKYRHRSRQLKHMSQATLIFVITFGIDLLSVILSGLDECDLPKSRRGS